MVCDNNNGQCAQSNVTAAAADRTSTTKRTQPTDQLAPAASLAAAKRSPGAVALCTLLATALQTAVYCCCYTACQRYSEQMCAASCQPGSSSPPAEHQLQHNNITTCCLPCNITLTCYATLLARLQSFTTRCMALLHAACCCCCEACYRACLQGHACWHAACCHAAWGHCWLLLLHHHSL
jgi:hypothetical protein